ncbi:MAG: LPS export ABC transporter permease LptF [Rhodobacterales bacterium]|nr:LPS export ABC transporter permease LptF [Rhodobacterales bacterium]
MLSQLMVLFGFFALVLVMVYWINRAVVLFDQLIADGQSAGVFLEFTALSLPNIIRIVLPLAAFAASLYVTNRMTAESELIVVQATGYSAFRLARPVLVFGLIVTLLMSVLTHVIAPLSAARLNLRQAEIAQNATARLLREGQFLAPTDGITFYIREISPQGELRDIFLSDTRSARDSVTYTAASAYLLRGESGPQLVMIDGLAQTLRREGNSLITTRFDELAYDIGAMVRLPDTTRRSSRELSTRELLFPTPAIIAETRKSEGALIVEGHGRFSEAILATVAALIGFATLLTGGFSRFGVWKQVVGAIFLVIVVKMVETLSVAVVRDVARLWPVTYLPALVGIGMIWFLLFWATRPYLLRRRPRAGAATGAAA